MSDPIEATRRAVEQLCKQWLLPGAAHEMEAAVQAHVLAVLEASRKTMPCSGLGPHEGACVHRGGGRVCLSALRERLAGKEME